MAFDIVLPVTTGPEATGPAGLDSVSSKSGPFVWSLFPLAVALACTVTRFAFDLRIVGMLAMALASLPAIGWLCGRQRQ